MDNGGSFVREEEELERFRLRERLQRYRRGENPSPDESVRVVNGDLHLEGDLILDELDAVGLIVECTHDRGNARSSRKDYSRRRCCARR